VTERELALRRTIFEAFAATGGPPQVDDVVTLRSLAEQQWLVRRPPRRGLAPAHRRAVAGDP